MQVKKASLHRISKKDFRDVWYIQQRIHESVARFNLDDTILSVEHNPVYTLGSASTSADFIISPSALKKKGVAIINTNRGGGTTYHGEGQLVIYPIFNMHRHYLDTHRYLRELEYAVIQTLSEYGIHAVQKKGLHKKENLTGVWVGDKKICSIGVRFKKWTTMHGLALNVNTDLSYFTYITACGLKKETTSIQAILNDKISLSDVESKLIGWIEKTFNMSVKEVASLTSLML